MGAMGGVSGVANFVKAKRASRDLSSLSMDQLQGHLGALGGMSQGFLGRRGGRNLTSMFTNEINRRKALQKTEMLSGVNSNIDGLGERVSNLEADMEELQGGGTGAVGDVAEGAVPTPGPEPVAATAPVNTGLPGQTKYFQPKISPFSPQSTIAMTSIYGTEEQRTNSIKR